MIYSFPGGIRRNNIREWDSSAAAELYHSPFTAYEMPETEGEVCVPAVSEGDTVLRGEIIGQSGGDRLCPVLSGVSGRVEVISKAGTIIIRSDDKMEETEPLSPILEDIMDVSPEKLIGVIREAAIPESGSDRLSLARFLEMNRGKLRHVFLNCAEPDPGSCTFSYLTESFPEETAGGLKILLRILGVGKGTVLLPGAEFKKNPLREAVRSSGVLRAACIQDNYPASDPRLIISCVTGKRIDPGSEPAEKGSAVFTPDTCLAVYYACTYGMRMTERIVTVTGDCVKKPAILRVSIGSGCRETAEKAGPKEVPLRLVSGFSPLSVRESGKTANAEVKGNTAVLYALSRRAAGEEETNRFFAWVKSLPFDCIGCGRCTEVCPVSLIPSELYRYAERLGTKSMRNAFIDFDGEFCIGCGCCTYICPSRLSLAEKITEAGRMLSEKSGKPEEPEE